MSIITTETSAPETSAPETSAPIASSRKRDLSLNIYHKIDDGYRIETSSGHEIFIDTADLELVSAHTWSVQYGSRSKSGLCGLIESAATKIPYTGIPNRKRRSIKMHRLILNLQHGDPRMVDHKDRNPLNNRRANLRIATKKENMHNSNKKRYQDGKSGTSIYKGVGYVSDCIRKKPWRSAIEVNGKYIHLGYDATEVEAARTFNTGALKYQGAFACLNVIPAAN